MLQTLDVCASDCEFKFAASGDRWTFEGYGSIFNSVDKGGDTILPGAYKKTLEEKGASGILMRYEHLRHTTPGKYTHAGEDSKGLLLAGELTPGHSLASDIRASFQHETIKGLSIGFRPFSSLRTKNSSGGHTYSLVDLVEVSITATPMEPQATVSSFKSEIESVQSLKEAELFLRESGSFSKSMATLFVSHIKSLIRSDSEAEMANEIADLRKKLEAKTASDQLIKALSNFKIGA